jgi:hypothetical protein
MLKTNLRHQRSNGDIEKDFSTSCIKCGFHEVEKVIGTGTDFDEKGWYNVVSYTCQESKCNHKWTEKVYILSGGTAQYHGKTQ